MAAKYHIDNKRKLIFTIWEGKATDITFIEAIKKYQVQLQGNPYYINYNEVLDFSGITNFEVTINGMRKVANIASRTDRMGPKRKLVIITPSNTTYFFARMYMIIRLYSIGNSKNIRIFSNESDAIVWLK